MQVTQKGRTFAFRFETVQEVSDFNAWLIDIGFGEHRVFLPAGANRAVRRAVRTMSPMVMTVADEDSAEAIRERWCLLQPSDCEFMTVFRSHTE